MDFENPINGKQFDNTTLRIYGEPKPEIMNTWNGEYGKATNAADSIARVGKKTQKMEREIQEVLRLEKAEREAELERKRQTRHFETTTAETFQAKDLQSNTVGRKVMRT